MPSARHRLPVFVPRFDSNESNTNLRVLSKPVGTIPVFPFSGSADALAKGFDNFVFVLLAQGFEGEKLAHEPVASSWPGDDTRTYATAGMGGRLIGLVRMQMGGFQSHCAARRPEHCTSATTTFHFVVIVESQDLPPAFSQAGLPPATCQRHGLS